MVKKLASYNTKELLSPTEIKERNLDKKDFSSNWQGRAIIIDLENSKIAKQMGIKQKGEYTIKVR